MLLKTLPEFDQFIGSLEEQGSRKHRQLREGEFLVQVVDDVIQYFETHKLLQGFHYT
jgi:hypothetical protein